MWSWSRLSSPGRRRHASRKVEEDPPQDRGNRTAEAAAEQSLANLLAEQASIAEQISELSRRTDVVYANAQRAYGAVAQQRESARIAELAKADQESAHWRDLAGQTVDPILRQAYLARAEGDFSDN